MAWILKKTVTNIGTTGKPTLWTWKQIVYQYWNDTDNTYIINNESRVVIETYLGRTNNSGSYYQGKINVNVNLDGTSKSNNNQTYGYTEVAANAWSLLYTATYDNVKHNSDGTKNITVSSAMSSSIVSPYSASASGTIELETIPRGSKLADGTGGYVNGSNIDDGVNIYITKYVDSFYDQLRIKYFDVVQNQWVDNFKIINGIQNGDAVTFTEAELDTLYSTSIPNKVAGLIFDLYSYTDDTYETVVDENPSHRISSRKLNILEPTFSDFDYSDVNTDSQIGTTRLTNDNQTIIKGYSTLRVSISLEDQAVSNTRQTPISHYIIDGETELYTGSAITKDIPSYSKDNVSVYAVDARNTASSSINKSFIALDKYVDYSNIIKDDGQSYSRSDGGAGGFVTLDFSGSWWGNKPFGTNANAVTNSISATYKYRISGTEQWTTPTNPDLTLTLDKAEQTDTYYTLYSYNNIVNGDQSDNTFDVSQSYDIMVIVSDELSSVEYNFSIHAGEPAIALYGNKVSLGKKYDETLGGIQLWGDVYVNGVLLNNNQNN